LQVEAGVVLVMEEQVRQVVVVVRVVTALTTHRLGLRLHQNCLVDLVVALQLKRLLAQLSARHTR
jgi:FAD synthase